MFPPSPIFTEKDIPSQEGRVFLITGGSAGIGFELAKALYHLNGRVYITSRTESSAQKAISSIQTSSPHPSQQVKAGSGSIQYLLLNLSDLSTVKATAEQFLSKEKRLDIIWHNAGTMVPSDPNETTAQGYHQQIGINVLAPFLLQHFLTPLVLNTAALPFTPKNSVRVIFVSSSAHRASPPPDGVAWDDINLDKTEKVGSRKEIERYGQSKAMNVMQAHEFARRYHDRGIISLSLHPGALSTGLQKHLPGWFNAVFGLLRKEPRFGALTELFAGIGDIGEGEEKMLEQGGRNGSYILPWGRWGEGSKEVFEGLKERGTGERLWGICEEMVKEFM